MEYAAADARAPMRAVWKALLKGWLPVKYPFAKPKIINAIKVKATDATRAFLATEMIMYGKRGTSPPTTYEMAIVKALCSALIGSGFSSPSSNLKPHGDQILIYY